MEMELDWKLDMGIELLANEDEVLDVVGGGV